MDDDLTQKVNSMPEYQTLVKERSRFGWILTAIILIVYYGFILLVAFNGDFLSKTFNDSIITYGLPLGIGVILITIIATGIYVHRANTRYDDLNKIVCDEVEK